MDAGYPFFTTPEDCPAISPKIPGASTVILPYSKSMELSWILVIKNHRVVYDSSYFEGIYICVSLTRIYQTSGSKEYYLGPGCGFHF